MSNLTRDPRAFWDEMYNREDYRYGTQPNAFLAESITKLLKPGQRVLCIGDGEGRNGVWLAEQDFLVTSVEPSSVGLSKALALSIERDVSVTLIRDKMPSAHVFVSSYDAVVLTYIHLPPSVRPVVHAAAVNALVPGGVILLEAFTPGQIHNDRKSGGPGNEAMLYSEKLLQGDFGDLEIEHLQEVITELDEGPGHRGPADVVRMIARKPKG